jgi:hypothetical protein
MAKFTCLDMLFYSFSTSVLAGSSWLCGPWIGCLLHCFGYPCSVVLGLLRSCNWVVVVVVAGRTLLIRALLHTLDSALQLTWIQWLPAISEMFCSLALDDLKLFSRRHRHNAYDMVHLGYPRVMDCTLSMLLA